MDIDRIKELFRGGLTQREIHTQSGIPREKIRLICKGIKPPRKIEIPADTRAAIVKMMRAGYLNTEIKTVHDFPLYKLADLRRELGIPRSKAHTPQAAAGSRAFHFQRNAEAEERLRNPIREYMENGHLVKVYPAAYAMGISSFIENHL